MEAKYYWPTEKSDQDKNHFAIKGHQKKKKERKKNILSLERRKHQVGICFKGLKHKLPMFPPAYSKFPPLSTLAKALPGQCAFCKYYYY